LGFAEKMEIVNVFEYEALAKEKLPKMVFDYYASGAEDQWTLQENRRAFERIRYFLITCLFDSHGFTLFPPACTCYFIVVAVPLK
jgi:hypothetical protein